MWCHERFMDWGRIYPNAPNAFVGRGRLEMTFFHDVNGVGIAIANELSIQGGKCNFIAISRVYPNGKVKYRGQKIIDAGRGEKRPDVSRAEFMDLMAHVVPRLEFLPAPEGHPLAAQAEQSRGKMLALLRKAFPATKTV